MTSLLLVLLASSQGSPATPPSSACAEAARIHAEATSLAERFEHAAAASRFRYVFELCPEGFPAANARAEAEEDRAFVQSAPPSRPAAAEARPKVASKPSVLRYLRGEPQTNSARIELMVGQGVHGLYLGLGVLCGALLGCNSAEAFLAGGMLTSLAALGASWAGSSAGLTNGQALAVNSGSFWGSLLAGLISVARGGDYGILALAGSVLGTGAGAAVAVFLRPAAGRVALMNTAGVVGTLFGILLMDSQLGGALVPWFPAIFASVGLTGGALLSAVVPLSRGRVWALDLGGMIGGIGLWAVTVGLPLNASTRLVAGMTGMAAGMLLASFVTRELDFDPEDVPDVALAPVGPAGSVGLTAMVSF